MDGCTTTLLPEVFTQNNFVTDFIRLKLTFIPKNESFWATLSGLRGNICTPSIACWKARGRLHIRHNWTFFAISDGWDVISGNLSKLAFFEGGGSIWLQISEGGGIDWPSAHVQSFLDHCDIRCSVCYLEHRCKPCSHEDVDGTLSTTTGLPAASYSSQVWCWIRHQTSLSLSSATTPHWPFYTTSSYLHDPPDSRPRGRPQLGTMPTVDGVRCSLRNWTRHINTSHPICPDLPGTHSSASSECSSSWS